jgi:hypothetical protein
MPEERARILALLQEGKITVEEAEQLLDALGRGPARPEPSGGRPPGGIPPYRPAPSGVPPSRRLTIRITDLRSGRVKTHVRLPAGAWGLISKLTRTQLGRRMSGLALQDIQRAAREGGSGHILDVTNDEKGERVEILLE